MSKRMLNTNVNEQPPSKRQRLSTMSRNFNHNKGTDLNHNSNNRNQLKLLSHIYLKNAQHSCISFSS